MKNKVRVSNMRSSNGKNVPNQFIIETDKGTFFQSYQTIIAHRKNDGSVVLDKNSWDCSVITGKYRNQFLGEGISETRRKIADGKYKLADLN